MSKHELKPCPFCGNPGIQHVPAPVGIRPEGRFAHRLRCASCGAQDCGEFYTEEAAAAAWNKRPVEDKLRAELAERDETTHKLREVAKPVVAAARHFLQFGGSRDVTHSQWVAFVAAFEGGE